MRIFSLILLLVGLFWLQSCYYDNAEDYYSNFPTSGCDTTAVSFAAKVKPIIDANCATPGCHTASNPAAGVDLSTVTQVQTWADRVVIRTQAGTMPPSGRMNDCNINTIAAWVNQGKGAN
jgi:uncharacterized membrane protein